MFIPIIILHVKQLEVKILNSLTPKQIVEKLDDYIVGQHDAKKAVALALRNRYRRQLLPRSITGGNNA